ncbi:hypothetical protein SPM66_03960 [Enterobacter hormaechei subsp. xiangfangensis]|nr:MULTISPECIES: hypothetical protein [Enterobacter]MBF1979050.1 hypothetical protein [Enterobacter hormaechei]MBY0606020.1 hypothetical protein [Enterobacter sp. TF2-1-2]MBY0622031.1 hypothetical protein [Enterobacter sp. TF5]MCM8111670.1 hypothetical protein [Enterobacter hormaechei]MCW4725380.1 hypothetical protein [Enterobacter hormaechei subsp. xiangfangensis]
MSNPRQNAASGRHPLRASQTPHTRRSHASISLTDRTQQRATTTRTDA